MSLSKAIVGAQPFKIDGAGGAEFKPEEFYGEFVNLDLANESCQEIIQSSKALKDAAKIAPVKLDLKNNKGKLVPVYLKATPLDKGEGSHKRLVFCAAKQLLDNNVAVTLNPLAASFGVDKAKDPIVYNTLVPGYEFLAYWYPVNVGVVAAKLKDLHGGDKDHEDDLKSLARQRVEATAGASAATTEMPYMDWLQQNSKLVTAAKTAVPLTSSSSIKKRVADLKALLP